MSSTTQRLEHLSPERRALLQRLLRERTAAKADPREVRRREGDGPVALSFAQQRLWFIDQMEPGTPTYNMLHTLRLRGTLNVDALRRSFTEVVRRHEVLRTTFAMRDGEPVQVIHPPMPVPLPVVALSGLGAETGVAAARELARAESLRPFDLARGPLLRSTLLRLGGAEHVLVFCMHHIASDGWSLGLLVGELSALYAAHSGERELSLPELPVQYADYAVWQREYLAGEVLEKQLAYWREHLDGVPPLLELPVDRPRAAGRSQRSFSYTFALTPELTQALRETGVRDGATLFMAVLAVWQALLSKYSGQMDVVVGTPITGRTRRELEGLIGLFVNMLTMRTDLSGDPTFRELLGCVRETTLGAFQHQDLPFERLVEDLKVERSLTHTPLFQASFSLEVAGRGEMELEGLATESFGVGSANYPLDLNLAVLDWGDRLTVTVAYQAALFEGATIERMVEHLRVLLETVAADPERRVSGVPLLRGPERTQVLEEWNATVAGFPRGVCVHGTSPRRPPARRAPPQSSRGTSRSPTPRWTGLQTRWRTPWRHAAWARTSGWGSAWSGECRCWWRSWGC